MIINPVAGVDYPARLAELRQWFGTDADSVGLLDCLRWPGGFVRPHSGATSGSGGADGLWRCAGCR
ncbi:MAG: hypothetical protein FWD59_05655 [Micrococcales bacterium]|nr:hypothetical protein [Micrococcales bacterium]